MEYDPSGPFVTSLLELKLDQNTVFEWQRCSQDSKEVPLTRNYSIFWILGLRRPKLFLNWIERVHYPLLGNLTIKGLLMPPTLVKIA